MFLSEFGSIIEGLAGGPGIFDDQPYLIIQKGGGALESPPVYKKWHSALFVWFLNNSLGKG